jgi:hypothetical protein
MVTDHGPWPDGRGDMLSTAVARELTGAVRNISAGIEAQKNAVTTSVRLLVDTAGRRELPHVREDAPAVVDRSLTRC